MQTDGEFTGDNTCDNTGDNDAAADTLDARERAVLAGVTAGTMIMTRDGSVPAEWLEVGDEVLTRDRGFQKILWINRIKLSRDELWDFPEFAPVRVDQGQMDLVAEPRDCVLSRNQLVLLRSPMADRDYWSTDVLIPAAALGTALEPAGMHWATRVSYTQILLSSHQLIMSDGFWIGSLFTAGLALEFEPGACVLADQLDTRRMIAARPVLTCDEAVALLQEHRAWLERQMPEETAEFRRVS